MPLIEQLHLKQNEATARLRSRKRKLSELYSATVNDGNHRAIKPNDTYKQGLKAFLDANDFERGVAFNENTLPPRPHITRLTRQNNAKRTLGYAKDPSKSISRSSSPAKSSAGLSPRPLKDALPVQKPDSPSRKPSNSPENDAAATEDIELDDAVDLVDSVKHRGQPSPPGSAEDVFGDVVISQGTGNGKIETRSKEQTDGQNLQVPVEKVGGRSRRSTPDSSTSRLEKNRRSRSPLVLAPVSNVADPQSSPASTDGPGSSNTPAPTAGSPTTSPGDEEPPLKSRDYPTPLATEEDVGSNQHSAGTEATGAGSRIDESFSVDPTDAPDTSVLQPASEDATKLDIHSNTSSGSGQHRPSMRINTQTGINNYFKPQPTSGVVESPIAMTGSVTPRRTPAAGSAQEPEKRATRISSGALQKKSVSEILGETPKTLSPQIESPSSLTPRDAYSPNTAQSRLLDKEKRERDRTKMSTVVFAKPTRTSDASDTIELVRRKTSDGKQDSSKPRDYLYSLFENRAYSPPKNAPLASLIHEAHKTVSTADHLIDYREQANCRALKRIYQLQNCNRWPLRQPKRAEEVPRPTSHWDFLLDDAKWMRTDFREERKWKLAAAKGLAEWCAEYVASTKEEQARLRVRVRPRGKSVEDDSDVVMEEGPGPALSSAQSTPDLIPSGEDDSIIDGIIADPRELSLADAPAAIFSLGASDFAFTIDKTPAAEKILGELPLYEPAAIVPDMSKSDLAQQMDARWKQDIVPISKFAVEKLHFSDPEPPRKRSRYSYEQEDSPKGETRPLSPQQKDVALFQLENKHMRDRIHPSHSFRPPSEYPMPTQQFFETRSSSKWTRGEDEELKRLVRDYSYNWSLISSCLTSTSTFVYPADRRTPWECFERWVSLEGLPADMSKTPYFRAYSSRIEAAQKHVQAQYEAALQRPGGNMPLYRKRSTMPIRVEWKHSRKHLAMLDVMKRLARKREAAEQKRQHQADSAATRKINNEANHQQPRPPISTPGEFSKLKHERELKLAERQEVYRQQLIAHQRAAATQQQRGQAGSANGPPNGVPRIPSGVPNGVGVPGMGQMSNGNLAVPPGHPRALPMQNMANGLLNGAPVPPGMMGTNAMQAQIQARLGRNLGSSPENHARMLEQVKHVQAQQIIAQRQAAQNAAQNGIHSSPNMPNASMAGSNGVNNVNNAAYLASLAANGAPSPSINLDGAAGSPRAQNALGQALSSGQIPLVSQIQTNIRLQFPQATDEQVMSMTNNQLNRISQATNAAAGIQKPNNRNQAAFNAAMGAINAGAHAGNSAAANAAAAATAAAYGQGNPMMTNEQVQQYNQQMRAQQAAQRANGRFPGGPMAQGAGMMGMGSSPVMNMARPVSQQGIQGQQPGQMSRSATPREQRSGSTGNGNGGVMMGQGSPRNQPQAMQQ